MTTVLHADSSAVECSQDAAGATTGRLSDFVDPKSLQNLPSRFRNMLGGVIVEMVKEEAAFLRVRPSCIENWWFVSVESKGIVRQKATDRSISKGYAVLFLSVNGQLRAVSGGPQIVSPGRLSLQSGETPFELFYSREIRYLTVHIPVEDLEAAAPHGAVPFSKNISVFSGSGVVLAASLRTLASEAAHADDADSLAPLLPPLAQLVLQAFSQNPTLPVRRSAPERMMRIREYLESHLTDANLSSETVSRACGISERQLFRDFATCGDRFNETLRGLRLERAALYLVARPWTPVTKVAEACGFQNPSSFARSFHAAFDMSPRDYRRLHLKMSAAETAETCAQPK